MRYADASALLRVLFAEPGPRMSWDPSERVVSSQVVEVECYRALERARLVGALDDGLTAVKQKELGDLLAMIDLAPVDGLVIEGAKRSFSVNVRALDAIHVATAELLAADAGEALEFWTHDARQALAALSRGLTVRGLSSDDPGFPRTVREALAVFDTGWPDDTPSDIAERHDDYLAEAYLDRHEPD